MFQTDQNNQALKDKRNVLHQSEQKKRREEVLFKLRKKFIEPSTPSRDDLQQLKSVFDGFSIAAMSTREGRRSLKQVIRMITQKPWEFQFHSSKILTVSSTLLQMPINENTISIIYDTLKMLINLNQQNGFCILDEVWKLMGASLKYINQQHGYLLIKSCLILSGNSLSEYGSIDYLSRDQCIESMFQIIFELLQTSDKGVIQETLWMLINIHQISKLNQNIHSKVLFNLTNQKMWDLTTKYVEKYADDQDFMKELLWLVCLITKSNPCHQAQSLALNSLSRINPQHQKTLLITLMILTQLSSQGLCPKILVDLLSSIYNQTDAFCQREIIICLSNLFVKDPQCGDIFLANSYKDEILFHQLQFHQQDCLYLVYNLVNNSRSAFNLLRQNTELISTIRIIMNNQALSQDMIQIFSQLVF